MQCPPCNDGCSTMRLLVRYKIRRLTSPLSRPWKIRKAGVAQLLSTPSFCRLPFAVLVLVMVTMESFWDKKRGRRPLLSKDHVTSRTHLAA